MGKKYLVVMMSAVGDAVHVLPVINAIKRDDPTSHITWVLQPGPASLVSGHPSVDEIILFDRSKGLNAFTSIRSELKSHQFDLVINLQVYFKAGIVTAFANAPVKLGFDRARARDFNWLFTNRKIPAHPIQHVQDQYFEFLIELGISHEPVEWNLGPWEDEKDWQRQWLSKFTQPVAAIVVGTSKPSKDWLPERWTEVCDVLYRDYNMQPVLVGGRSERELAAERVIMERAKHKPVSELGSGLRKLVSILDASKLVLAPDTGPLHMAVALGTPTISLMGYTDPRRTGPYRKFHDLIIDRYNWSEDGEGLLPRRNEREAGKSPSPSSRGAITMETRPNQMHHITVADVTKKIELFRSKY